MTCERDEEREIDGGDWEGEVKMRRAEWSRQRGCGERLARSDEGAE